MKTKDYILFGTLTLAGLFVARLIISKLALRDNFVGSLSKKDIARLYSQVKL
jgi:hypothetical protein